MKDGLPDDHAPDELVYPLAISPGAGDGSAVEVSPGAFWLRMAMPRGFDNINVWALDDGEGWAIVDTGLGSTETETSWKAALEGQLGGRGVTRLFLTHLHPDHSGMIGWLADQYDARLWTTRLEYLMLRVMAGDTGRAAPPEALAFYHGAGWGQAALDRYRARFGAFGTYMRQLPDAFRRIVDGEQIPIGQHRWEVVVGTGHSPEHACMYDAERKLLISGDQILPRISSNISVQPLEPDADPLSDWLHSLAGVARRVPDDVLVLPAHGEPFVGLHKRINRLTTGHEQALERVHALLASPARAIDIFPALYRRAITPELLGMATGESIAHLNCLQTRGLAVRQTDAEGIHWWRQA